MAAEGYFITGTDTGVGKTTVAASLLRSFVAWGKKAVGMKPVVSGCDETVHGTRCDDVAILQAASNVAAPLEWINPYRFVPPVAPHIAARQTGVDIDLEVIVQAYDQLAKLADVVVVEGAGGFLVPLNETADTADLAKRLNLPVIMVVGMRLGCINHALLTSEAIRSRGLTLYGWVANCPLPEKMLFLDDNIMSLQRRIHAPLLGVIPYGKEPCLKMPNI
jgi:dethiobiotin synthetase